MHQVYLVSLNLIIAGGGVESEQHYPQWRRITQSIERPAMLNESLIKLIEGKLFSEWFDC
jgi:hypothetical protein